MSLRDQIFARIEALKILAQMADEAKPGVWVASRTHDGVVWTNRSHVYSEHRHEGGYGSRGVAHLIIDDLADNTWPTRPVGEDPPQPAVVAEYIAAHGPADALRRYTADRERLEEHHPCNDDDTDDPCGAHSTRYECCPCHTPGPCVEQYRIAEALSIIGPDATPEDSSHDRRPPRR